MAGKKFFFNLWSSSPRPLSFLWGWLALVLLILHFSKTFLYAQEEIFERYDPNTEVTLKGKIVEILVGGRKPVIIGVKKQEKIYYVVLAPQWFIIENHIEIGYQDEIIVKGAKFFAPDGSFLILAKTLENLKTGKKYFFRDEFLKPCWRRGPHHKLSDSPKGHIP